MKSQHVEADLYDTAGFKVAHEKMREEIKPPFYPPSVDGFATELKKRNSGFKTCSPEHLADLIIQRAREKGHTKS